VTAVEGSPVIEVRDVWRRYRLAAPSKRSTLRGTLVGGRQSLRRDWFWALRGVDITVGRGRALAVIGRNGAGKSTLLRLMGGIGRPDRGSVRVHGRVGALLDLGREFHPDLTGRQNAELAAVVGGLSRAAFARRCDEIVAFAGLEAFIDQPLHAYSDGMRARLAFSVLAHVDPDVLLVDEVLAVGDAAFQRRSIDRIERLRAGGTTVVFVSHDLSLVRQVCDEAAWLDGGVIRSAGGAEAVVAEYLATTTAGSALDVGGRPGEGALLAVRLLDRWGVGTDVIRGGDALAVEVEAEAAAALGPLLVAVKLVRVDGHDTVAVDTSTPLPPRRQVLRVQFDRLDLAPGRYEVIVGVYASDWSRRHDERRVTIDVSGDGATRAALAPPHEWRHVPGTGG
jgi:lipopolysaccharide transport system ATP-binding protein